MITYDALHDLAPAITTPITARLTAAGVGLLGTVRRHGGPRVSPIEVAIDDGRLYVGMMPASQKALDVARDPRYALLTPVADREDLAGEGKLFGRVEPITDQEHADDLLRAAAEVAGFDPETIRGSPMFELLVDGAAWQHLDGEVWDTLSWRFGGAVRHHRRETPTDPPTLVG